MTDADQRGDAWRCSPGSSSTPARQRQCPAYPWTLETLARSAGVSRPTLARRFSTEVGCPQAEYLTKWRMELAANKLRLTTLPVAHIARDVGYTSEYAFNRTFARWQGVPPGRYRTAFLAAESAVSASAESDPASCVDRAAKASVPGRLERRFS
ncbi:MAG: helix-turn-helix transcriptional regulator [Mycobacterium sp.]|nr:helix-turn-helix transcriptional regulator [Mycobacterium sp.]